MRIIYFQIKRSVELYSLGCSIVFNECNSDKQEAAMKAFLKQRNYATVVILKAETPSEELGFCSNYSHQFLATSGVHLLISA